jgi:hypothetical protein
VRIFISVHPQQSRSLPASVRRVHRQVGRSGGRAWRICFHRMSCRAQCARTRVATSQKLTCFSIHFKAAASFSSIAISTARLARLSSRFDSRFSFLDDRTLFAISLQILADGKAIGILRRSSIDIAGYMDAVVCRSKISEIIGVRKKTSSTSGSIRFGRKTAKPDEQTNPSCSGSSMQTIGESGEQ